MKKNPLEIQHLTAADFRQTPFEKVILPLGSLESHGGHLPFGTDALTAYLLALDIAARLPKTAVLPPLNYGVSEHYRDFAFTVTVQFETQTAFLRDILESANSSSS
jgi:creatinine amidohydrolase